jgi:hypothetical protein
MANEHTGSETIGAAGEKGKMTLFRDDRAEDFGAILLAILVIAVVVVMTTVKAPAPPASPVQPAPSAASGVQGAGGPPAARP